ncbi:MAG: metallophosphoesterase [Acidobacteriota bacterium]|nr:metallophosphoesterase [Acidobacteriota bacterium]
MKAPEPPLIRRMPPAQIADPHRRPLFHPKTGSVRRVERSVSLLLSRYLYPWISGLPVCYDWQLARRLTSAEVDVVLPDLPEPFDGLEILLLTDLHAGPFVSPRALSTACARLCAQLPDLIMIGGDIVTSDLQELESHRDVIAALEAPMGVFGVLGNHDHYTGCGDRVSLLMEELGVTMLQNRSVELERGGSRLWLAGVDDMNSGSPDLERALAGVRRPSILLSHNPDFFFAAARAGVDLVLSGHTHGGQIRIPGRGVLVRQSRYHLDEGAYRVGSAQLVVSRGLGVSGVPLRLGCPPEGVRIRLHYAPARSTTFDNDSRTS